MTPASLPPTGLQDLYAVHNSTPPPPNPNTSPQSRKLFKECQKFEALLITNLWNEMEQGVSMAGPMSGGASDPGADTMQGFGIQSAATGLANAGGLGIARMLYQELSPSLAHPHAAQGAGKNAI
ncbi:MAG: hypothetical protein ACRD18_08930 [Terriglobia bacterium]